MARETRLSTGKGQFTRLSVALALVPMALGCEKSDPPPPPPAPVALAPPVRFAASFDPFLELVGTHKGDPTHALPEEFTACNTDNPDGLDFGFCSTQFKGDAFRVVVWDKTVPSAFRFESETVPVRRSLKCDDFVSDTVKSWRSGGQEIAVCKVTRGALAGFLLYVRNTLNPLESTLIVLSPEFLNRSESWKTAIARGGR